MKQLIMLCRFRPFYFLLFLLATHCYPASSQDQSTSPDKPPLRLNFLVSPRQKKIDGAPISFQLQAGRMQMYQQGDLHMIVAGSSKEMAKKITRILKRRKAMIGTLWFDSHGHFSRRRSLFEIGEEEFNYQTIRDSALTVELKKLFPYCDTATSIGIGSCYGGATYTLPAVENIPAQRMNGDSLMMGVSALFNKATVYASESFVMTGPGILNATYALTGAPCRKKFKDPIYAPVWEKLGEWNCYSGKKAAFEKPVTISLDQKGRISCKQRNYLSYPKNQKKLEKKLKKFKRGNYNIANLYRYADLPS